MGDPLILVYAVRHALEHPQRGHVVTFVVQAIEANAGQLSGAARRAIVRDVTAWLDGPGGDAEPADRAVWIAALAVLGVDA